MARAKINSLTVLNHDSGLTRNSLVGQVDPLRPLDVCDITVSEVVGVESKGSGRYLGSMLFSMLGGIDKSASSIVLLLLA